ncbi:MAG: type II and III secretion system protein [Bacteroidales bacterium]|nr:type II and III secretion system protein [Bacteroidales bacterium]
MKINITIIFLLLSVIGFGQFISRDSIEIELRKLAVNEPALNSKVSVSVEDIDLGNFLRAVANNSKVNLNIDPEIKFNVTNNFSDVKVVDLLVFVCKQYNLRVKITGNIISIYMPESVIEEVIPPKQKEILISYSDSTDFLSFDLKNDTLDQVVRMIVIKTSKNIIVAPEIKNKVISGYVQKESFDKALSMLAFANNLAFRTNDEGYMIIEPIKQSAETGITSNSNTSTSGRRDTKNTQNQENAKNLSSLVFKTLENGRFNVYCEKINLDDLVKYLCDTLNINYFITTPLTADVSLSLTDSDFETFLMHVFSGLKFSYIKKDDIYLFGDTQIQELRVIRNIQLQYRSVENLEKIIPSELKKDLEIKEFLDLNSLLVSGSIAKVNATEQFLMDIDKLVPVVLIEVMVVDISKSSNISTGITFGTTTQEIQSGGNVFPGLDYTFNAASINAILASFEGFGSLNLGRVNSNFYMSLKALESNGNIKIRSTPQLATLNGKEANLTIGKTTYYKEQKQDLAINQSTTSVTTVSFKPVKADLTIKIKPVVSGDEQITLEIEVKQSDFGARTDPDAPPDQVSREFKSTIRVKNQEMILLGGLEESTDSQTSSGTPLLSRVPVIKWFFSSREKENKNTKLNIFIKPTVIN